MSIAAAITGQNAPSFHLRAGISQDQPASLVAPPVPEANEAPAPAAVGSGLAALLGRIGLSGPAAATAADAVTATVKPNLDALNRVLNHYRAQSEALHTIVSLGA